MRTVFKILVPSLIVLTMGTACRTTSTMDDASSGLSEVSIPVPAEVAKNLPNGGTALLKATNPKPETETKALREFKSQIVFAAKGAAEPITFNVDQHGDELKINDELRGINLSLLDEEGWLIYEGEANPKDRVMRASANEIEFNLVCAKTAAATQKCNGLNQITFVGVQGQAGTTSASIQAKINIKSTGMTFAARRNEVVRCMAEFEKYQACSFWDRNAAGGAATCERLKVFKNSEGINNLETHVASLTSNTDLDVYVGYCQDLGIFAK